jgi:hypothetical protein
VSRPDSRGPGAGRAVWSLGTCCGTLAVAAFVSAVYPVPEPVLRSGGSPAQDDVLSALTDVWFPLDGSAPVGGPLEAPTIGVGLPEYDDQMEALEAAREASPRTPVRGDARPTPTPDPAEGVEPPLGELPSSPPDPPELPPVVSAPQTPSTPPTTPPAPSTTPPAAPPATETPTAPTPTTPPTAEPTEPTEEPPPPPPPEDTTLALGERYDHVDAAGTVLFSITLVRIDTALVCTAPGVLPAENGHLIGLHVEVVAQDAPTEPPTVTAADFRFLDDTGALTADVDTGSSAACLDDDTVVLDVPALTGTVVYRPASWPAALRWDVPPGE